MSSRSSFVGAVLADGRYEIAAPLGAGGMASVFLANDRRLDCQVVVKMPHGHLLDCDPTFQQRFLAEMRSLVVVCHPHIVKITDAGRCAEGPFAVLQYLPGGTLKDAIEQLHVQRPDAIPWRELWSWLPTIADAIDYLHGRGLIHRDIKPANILFDSERRAYLSDFGLVRVVGESSTRLTQTGLVVGTPAYMAPESKRFLPLDGRADQYSLAVTVQQFLFGRRGGEQAKASHGALPGSAPRSVIEVLTRATAHDRTLRFKNCSEFATALRTAWVPETTAGLIAADRSGPAAHLSWPRDESLGSTTGDTPAGVAEQTAATSNPTSDVEVSQASNASPGDRRLWLLAASAVVVAVVFAVWLNLPTSQADLIRRDAAAIVGRWRNESGLTMEFFPDGRLREKRLFDVGEGTYEILPSRKIKITTQGMFGGLLPTGGQGTLHYQVSGQDLALSAESGIALTLRYRREP